MIKLKDKKSTGVRVKINVAPDKSVLFGSAVMYQMLYYGFGVKVQFLNIKLPSHISRLASL